MESMIEALKIDQLSVTQRLELIEKIWDSLPEELAPNQIPAWHRTILAERLTASEKSPESARPWREVVDEIEKSL